MSSVAGNIRLSSFAVLLLLVALLCISGRSNADDKLLQELSSRSANIQSVSGYFRQQRSIQQLPVALQSNGRFSYSPSEGITWQTVQPVESVLSISEQGLLLDSRNQSTPSPLFARLVLKLFLGDMKALEQYFVVRATGNPGSWRIHLSPTNEALALQYENIQVKGGEFTESLMLNESSGDSTTIDFYDVSVSSVANGMRH